MTSVEFLIIYVSISLFISMYILYRAMDRLRGLVVCNSKATVKLFDALCEMEKTMELYRKAAVEIVSALNEMDNKQDNRFEWIRKELLKKAE